MLAMGENEAKMGHSFIFPSLMCLLKYCIQKILSAYEYRIIWREDSELNYLNCPVPSISELTLPIPGT